MILASQVPAPPLRDFIETFWFYEDLIVPYSRERVLPDGSFELIINLRDQPRKLYPRDGNREATDFHRAWISGTHSEYIVIDVAAGSSLIGAHFKPGGAAMFLGLPAGHLCNQVIELEDLWTTGVSELRDALIEAPLPSGKFRVLETFLRRRARPDWAFDGVARHALERLQRSPQGTVIDQLAREAGLSHKQFISRFRAEVGLTPKRFCRIQRFQQVLRSIKRQQPVAWADIAADCGYYDQAHFIQEFRGFSGLNPTAYLRERGDFARFVPMS